SLLLRKMDPRFRTLLSGINQGCLSRRPDEGRDPGLRARLARLGAPSCLDPGLRRDDQVMSRAKFRASGRPVFSAPTGFPRHFPRTAVRFRKDDGACTWAPRLARIDAD